MSVLHRSSSVLEPSTTGARKRLDAIIELERLLADDAQRVVRVVPSSSMLAGLGSVLMHSEGSAATYDMSKPAEVIPCFVSHSWATGRWSKTTAIAYYFHKWPAVALSVATMLLMLGFTIFQARPDLCRPPFDVGIWLSDTGSAAMVATLPGVVFLATVFFAHTLPGLSTDCFLDKVCIHQTDQALKKEAIDSLDLFLRFSRRLLVLWSPEYPTRLWCTYELATFIKLHPDGAARVDIMPSFLPKYTLFMFVFCAVTMPICALSATGPLYLYMAEVLGGGYVAYVAILTIVIFFLSAPGAAFFYLKVKEHTEMLKQLANFRVADASCVNPQDVEFVHGLIEVMWSSTREANDGKERFEGFIRHELASQLEANFGPRTRLSYMATLVSNFPVFCVCPMLAIVCDVNMLDFWGYMSDEGSPELRSWALRWFVYGLELWCFANPIATVATQEALAWCIDRGRGAASCMTIGTLVYWVTLMPLIYLIVATVMYVPNETGAIQTFGGGLLLGLMTLACFPPEWVQQRYASFVTASGSTSYETLKDEKSEEAKAGTPSPTPIL